MTPPVLSFDAVRFAYGERTIFEDVSLAVAPGELIGVIGPNGAGKSTLCRIALGLERPHAGRVHLAGRPLAAYTQTERTQRVAAVLQEEQILFPATVEETVLLGRVPHLSGFGFESASDLAEAETAMRSTDVYELRARRITELSGGEKKRVLLARAFCQTPSLLVLDEPASALDIHHQIAIFEELKRRTTTQGLAVLAVIHDLNLAAQFCSRLVLCRAGFPIAIGSIEEILTYQRVRETFAIDVYVGVNELTGDRFLIPMRTRPGDG
jgi:iron complex transport system ATP-binding protein